MIDHDNSCSVLLPGGKCNCKGGEIRTHVHTMTQGHHRMYCVHPDCPYEVPLKEDPK